MKIDFAVTKVMVDQTSMGWTENDFFLSFLNNINRPVGDNPWHGKKFKDGVYYFKYQDNWPSPKQCELLNQDGWETFYFFH